MATKKIRKGDAVKYLRQIWAVEYVKPGQVMLVRGTRRLLTDEVDKLIPVSINA
jgi:hypothetical protein